MDLFTKYGIYASQLIGAYYKLLDEITLTSAQTFYDLDFSDFDKSKIYQIVIDQKFDVSGYTFLYVNDDKTDTNYISQILSANGTTDDAGRYDFSGIHNASVGQSSFSSVLVKHTNSGNVMYQTNGIINYDTTSPQLYSFAGKKDSVVSTLSKLTIQSTATSGLGVGTKIALYEITPASELIEEVIVSTDTDTVDFTSLAYGNTDDLYMECDLVNGSTSTLGYGIYVNSDETDSNYYGQRLVASSTSVSGSRSNYIRVAELLGGAYGYSLVDLKLANNGTFVATSEFVNSSPSIIKYVDSKNATITSIDSLTLKSSLADGIGAGSVIRLYRRKAKTIADEVQSADDSSITVDLTGKELENGQIYTINATLINNDSSASTNKLYINANTTDSNYTTQRINANGTTVDSSRFSIPVFGVPSSSSTSYCTASIFITEDGYLAFQNIEARNIGSSSLNLYENYTVSTFTVADIDSIEIQSNQTSGIGADSRVQIVKWTK